MAYNPTIWINDDGTGTVGTPVIANYMNNIEQGIKNNDEQINVLKDSPNFTGNPKVKGKQIATTTKMELTGYDIRGGFSYRIGFEQSVTKVGDICVLSLCLDTVISQTGVVILQLPEGYRPEKTIGSTCVYGANSATCLVEVLTSGEVRLWDFSSPMTTGGYLWINLTYKAV